MIIGLTNLCLFRMLKTASLTCWLEWALLVLWVARKLIYEIQLLASCWQEEMSYRPYRAVYCYLFLGVIWAISAYLRLNSFFVKYAVPSYVAVSAIVLGVIITSLIFRILIQKELRKIKETPDVEKIKLSAVLYLVGALFILVAGLYILFTNVAIETLAPAFYFAAPMPATACVTTAIMYVFWERKHQKKILSNDIFPKELHTSKIDESNIQQ